MKPRKKKPYMLKEPAVRAGLKKIESRFGFDALRYAATRYLQAKRDSQRLERIIRQRERELEELKRRIK